MNSASKQFNSGRRFFHWAIVIALLVQIPLAWYMIDLPLSPDKLAKYALHKSIGVLLLSLAVCRLIWSLLSGRPALPPDTPMYEKVLAKISQGLLYIIVILMPVTGWLMSSAANVPVVVFGVFKLPNLVEPDKAFMEGMQNAHEIQSIVLLTLVCLHVLAALRHHYFKRNNVLRSMLPFIRE